MKTLLRLAVSTVVVVANVQADVVMAEFELDLEARSVEQLQEIAKKDINVAFGVDAFTEHYRAHMWDIRNNYENTPEENEIVRYESLKYYNTVYKLIPTEIARCIFGIKGGMVEYTDNYNDILECKGSVPVERYNQSNWNYVVFVNVLNKYRNNNKAKVKDIIQTIVAGIIDKYKPQLSAAKQNLIRLSGGDIEQYFEVLRLKKYISGIMARKSSNQIEEDIAKYKQRLIINDGEAGWYRSVYPFNPTIKYDGYLVSGKHIYEIKINYNSSMYKTFSVASWNDYLRQFKALKEEGQYAFANKEIKYGYAKTNSNIRIALIKTGCDEDCETNMKQLYSLDKGMKDRIRSIINMLRRKAEHDEDISKYNKIIQIHNVLTKIGGYQCDDNGQVTDQVVGGMPDIVYSTGTDCEEGTDIKKMKKIYKDELDKFLELIIPTYADIKARKEIRNEIDKKKKRLEKLGDKEDEYEDKIEENKKKNAKSDTDLEQKLNNMKERIRKQESDIKTLRDELQDITKRIKNTKHAYEEITYFIERAVKKAEKRLKEN